MTARSASWSRRGDPGLIAPAAAGLAALAVAWALLHVGFLARGQIVDTPVYQRYGDAVVAGKLPYRDFVPEYPPAALAVFVPPALAPADDYRGWFEGLMLACAAAAVLLVAVTLRAVEATRARAYAATVLAGLGPLLLGSVVLTRYDLWPAALTAAALAALVSGRRALGFAALALAAAAKVYPLALLPLALVHVGRREGASAAAGGLAVFVAVLAAVIVPFAALAPDGFAASLERQMSRPLQIESLGSALLLAAHLVDGTYVPSVVSSFGSQNLSGSLPDALATVQTALQAVAVAAVWVVFARGRADAERLLAASAAAVAAFVAFGKVLSPQYLIWLVPLVPLVRGRLGIAASATLATALVLTHAWFPSRYWDVVDLEAIGGVVLARDLVLAALFVLVLAATRKESGAPRRR